jgi:hypothetical protein
VITATAHGGKNGSHSPDAKLSARRAANVSTLVRTDLAALHHHKAILRGVAKGSTSNAALEHTAIIAVAWDGPEPASINVP